MIKFVQISIFVILLCSCSFFSETQIEDERFNDTFFRRYKWVADDGINEVYLYERMEFDGTTTMYNTKYVKRYNSSSGWSYTGDYIGDKLYLTYNFETKNDNKYRFKFFNEEDWSNWYDYVFSDDRTLLRLYGKFAEDSAFDESFLTLCCSDYVSVAGENNIELKNVEILYSNGDFLLSFTDPGLCIEYIRILIKNTDNFNAHSYGIFPPYTEAHSLETMYEGYNYEITLNTHDLEEDISAGVTYYYP